MRPMHQRKRGARVIPRPQPEKGLNPYFIHPDDSTGWPSGPHCRWPRTEVECIECVVPIGHRHMTTRMWKFYPEMGEIKTQSITCTSKRWDKDGFDRHNWLWNGGPAGSNANIAYEALRNGWVTEELVAHKQRVDWFAQGVQARTEELRVAAVQLDEARRALSEAQSKLLALT